MNEQILVGIFVGFIIAFSTLLFYTDKLTLTQKFISFFAGILMLWPGLILYLIFRIYNNHTNISIGKNSKTTKQIKVEKQVKTLIEVSDNGLFIQTEFKDKLNIIENSNSDQNLNFSDYYKKLMELKLDGILTKEEFDQKVGFLTNLKPINKVEKFIPKKTEYYEVYRLFNPITKNLEVFRLSDLQKEFEKGNFLFQSDSTVTIIRDDDFDNPILERVKDYEPLRELIEYFSPDI